ncbi:RHS repeat-associated core domain-containing protein [Streptomyces canus]|uniref:RHS repeat-associated core domain-containing protein n=1 Tax=Streptomyces canus TaxID=58343 RepID=UPI0030DF5C2C
MRVEGDGRRGDPQVGVGRPSGACAQSGATTRQTYAGTDNTQRLTRDATTFANTAVGLTGQSAAGAATGFVREPSGTLVGMRSGASTQYYLSDAQGSVIGLLDTSGKRTATYTYRPYGEQRTNSGTQQPFRYSGSCLDPSGLHKMGARYHDPNLGRFTQPDPSGQEDNAYLYAGGAAVNHSDPTGLSFFGGLGKIFDASDHGTLAANLIKGDWKGAGATAIGIWTGAVTQVACEAALAALSVPTAGVAGFAGQGVCLGASYGVGNLAQGQAADAR